ncbi:MAG TPA: SDR family NAD(P)-dependent oxidoreductase [Methylomirabilota bacterium]|nr:SDR family NAD(P)-dependent oxidoreductase [Methylomirabilota bacterium]
MTALTGTVALVTGASRGIGRAIALALGREGARVCLVARRPAALADVAGESAFAAGAPVVHAADLTQDEAIDRLGATLESTLGRLDVLAHCAGAIARGPQATTTAADLDAQYRLNVRAPFLLTQRLLPLLRQAGGQVLFMNSSRGLASGAGIGAYAATKHALKALADALRDEVNADGVRVLSVYPGRTATPRQAELFAAEGRPYDPKRLLQPEDVASIVLSALTLPRTAEVTDIRIRPALKSY